MKLFFRVKCSYMFVLVCIFFSLSCTDQESPDNTEGLAVLRVSVGNDAAQEVSTKATFNESGIYNLHVLVYNGSGNLIGHGYSNTGNSVTLTTRVGTGNTVYAIANTYNSTLFDGFVATSELKLKTLLSSTSTLEGIKVSDSSTSGLVMSGSKSNVTISSSGTTISSSDFAISRLSAKITLNITGLNGIVITGYAIKNLPKKGYIVARPNTNESLVTDLAVGDDASSTSTDRFDTSVTGLSTSSYATSFYMYENRRGGRVNVSGTTGTSTNEREKVTYAPTGSTYVDISAKGTTFSSVYRVYLGADNSQNYSVKRNVNYTYNITLKGAMSYDTRVTTSILVTPTAVSASNCYMLTPGSAIRIPVSRANSAISGSIPDVTKNWDADLLWTDNSAGLASNGVIENIVADYSNGGIIVKAGTAEGNALVVVKNLSGTILWSWHIWVTSYNPNTGTTYTYNGYTWMDRNLGAKNATIGSAGAFGFFYQWGRKDPFPGPNANTAGNGNIITLYDRYGNALVRNSTGLKVEAVTNTVANYLQKSINNPLTFYAGVSGNDTDWYSYNAGTHNDYLWSTSSGTKNIYDPCPIGWRAPYATASTLWSGLSQSWDYTYLGQNWGATLGWWPAAGHPSGTDYAFAVGSGFFWTAQFSGTKGCYLDFYPVSPPDVTWTYGGGNMVRSLGASERCVKE